MSNRQFALGTPHAEVMHRLKNQGVQAGKEFVVIGVGDFAPWPEVIDALHAKTAPLFTDTQSRCHVFQFFMVDRYSARAMVEFVMWDLYAFLGTFGNKNLPRVVVLDEVQNLDLGPDAPVAKYLTEGRRHGLALITATQTVRGVGGVSDARVSRLFQAEHKLFFKPTENEMREHAQLLHNAMSNVNVQEWATRLSSLQKASAGLWAAA